MKLETFVPGMSLVAENDILKELECPVCLELMQPPILLCKNGHSVCNQCRRSMDKCPICRSEFVDTRNVIAENLSRSVKHPCKFHNSGCIEKFLSSDKSKHEDKCVYRPRKCPFSNVDLCPWLGALCQMKEHIIDSHMYLKSIGTDGVLNPCFTQLSKSGGWYEAIFALEEMFFMFTKVIEGFLYTTVTYLGPQEDAENYTFCITLMSIDGIEGSSSFKVCPSYLRFTDKFEKKNCVIFPLQLVEKCVNTEDELYFQYEIRFSDNSYFPSY
ncbi:hypothetical protein C0J52_24443 [Blattella germanica]|nr:hypothetical protein C0J52_24443 [Blattella germanica]